MSVQPVVQAKLGTVGVNTMMPAWQIINNARLLPPIPGSGLLFGDTVQQALLKLMKSYYEYGRQNWTWAQSAGGAAANGGLVKGAIDAVACGSFNYNFKWLAEKGLGITGISPESDSSQFLTVPGGICIDSKWHGNVLSSAAHEPSIFKCFKFSGHYWVKHQGINYDVCYNNTFGSTEEIIWTKLKQAKPDVLKKIKLNNKQVYELEKPLPYGDHLVMVAQNGANNWPTWRLVHKKTLKSIKPPVN